jgi:glycosyltransferase involved in cell wall biosynthesis
VEKIACFCTPTLHRPYPQYLEAFEASIPSLRAAGWTDKAVFEVGCPYISHARATMLRKALDAGAETIVFIDHDLAWRPEDLLKLIETPGRVVAGTYRYRSDDERYMGSIIEGEDLKPQLRDDGAIKAHRVPAGFLKITRETVHIFMRAYPELVYGPAYNASVDLFNHGVQDGIWYGEDMAFCKRWLALGEDIWLVPDLSLDHWTYDPAAQEHVAYRGNYHEYLLRQPGGSKHEG